MREQYPRAPIPIIDNHRKRKFQINKISILKQIKRSSKEPSSIQSGYRFNPERVFKWYNTEMKCRFKRIQAKIPWACYSLCEGQHNMGGHSRGHRRCVNSKNANLSLSDILKCHFKIFRSGSLSSQEFLPSRNPDRTDNWVYNKAFVRFRPFN